jgi:hypothetical protein
MRVYAGKAGSGFGAVFQLTRHCDRPETKEAADWSGLTPGHVNCAIGFQDRR